MVEGRFALTDHHGRAVCNDSFLGRYLLVYFGFTHCRVVCPRALARISAALDRLGPGADALVPLYVSVDPERDTPAVMRAFLESSYPRFTGLTGTRSQVDAAKQAFRVFAESRPDADDPDGYAVPHTSFTYLMGPDGGYLTHFADTVDEAALASRLEAELASPRAAAGSDRDIG